MKNTIKIIILLTIITAAFISCENPIGLGNKIFLEGPVINISVPSARQPVDGKFFIKGNMTSRNSFQSMTVKARSMSDNMELPIQWRCVGFSWEYTTNGIHTADGSWVPAGLWLPVPAVTLNEKDKDGNYIVINRKWIGSLYIAEWTLPIDLFLAKSNIKDGQYQFNITAYDIAGNSDSNSFKTRTVIVDTIPPMVTIVSPYVQDKPYYDLNEEGEEIYILHNLPDVPENRQDIQNLGKLMNKAMQLQYQLETDNDIWSIDIRFYDASITDWDDNEDGEENYVYKAWINEAKDRPTAPNPQDMAKPNYRFTVPDLTSPPVLNELWENPDERGINHFFKEAVTGKKTLHIVVRCLSAAGLEIQEKSMGCFIYWPESDLPWIDFLETMKMGAEYAPSVFPSTMVPVRAFDDDAVDKVEYSIYQINPDGTKGSIADGYPITETNPTESRVFSFQFSPPSVTGVYKVEAVVYDIYGVNDNFECHFEVLDISYPELREPHTPVASQPLYKFLPKDTGIGGWNLYIEGYATAESRIAGVSMVWINPHSTNYAAMSQLAYFRQADYAGWARAGNTVVTVPNVSANPGLDTIYDSTYPNKVWNMFLTDEGIDRTTNRRLFRYYMTVDLSDHMNIEPGASGKDFLKSQVFVFKATDTNESSPKSSMLTWSPQGDTEAPTIKITNVRIVRSSGRSDTYIPGEYADPIPQFGNGDQIIVNGEWKEDATTELKIETILSNNLKVSINGNLIDNNRFTTLTITPAAGYSPGGEGTWTARGTVKKLGTDDNGDLNHDDGSHTLVSEDLKDTLVFEAMLTDIGGSTSEFSTSWLIESDNLRFLRVGSNNPDGIYTYFDPNPPAGQTGDTVDISIFLEFSKPVILKHPGNLPILVLNTTGGASAGHAVYAGDPNEANTRQLFNYRVLPGHTAAPLTIKSLHPGHNHYDSNYPFTWIIPQALGTEEIRLVDAAGIPDTGDYYVHKIPTDDPNDMYSLLKGKNIRIDTAAPTLSSIQPNIRAGYYSHGGVIYVTMKFSEAIQIGDTDIPSLTFNISNDGLGTGGSGNSSLAVTVTDPQVSDDSLIFQYAVKDHDTTNYINLRITDFSGKVYDLAGNEFTYPAGGTYVLPYTFTATPATVDGVSITYIRVHAIKPPAPVLKAQTNTGGGNFDTFVTSEKSSYPGLVETDPVLGDIINKKNVYYGNLYILIEPQGAEDQKYRVEYSVNGGKDWAVYGTPFTTPKQRTTQGTYTLIARQYDRAGNRSDETTPVALYWDNGPLLTRISSDFANGIYTRNADIPITLTFRIPVKFNTAPTFTLSAKDPVNKKQIKPDNAINGQWEVPQAAAAYTHTFFYRVGTGDTTIYTGGDNPTRPYLALETMNMTGVSAVDNAGVEISSMINLNQVTSNNTNLQNLKKIEIQTSTPERTGIRFEDAASGITQGQNAEDDSYWTQLKIEFDEIIYSGPSNTKLTIIQKQDGYRLPAVLNETQRDRYRSLVNDVIDDNADITLNKGTTGFAFDRFYTLGTNGYRDQSDKYILNTEYYTGKNNAGDPTDAIVPDVNGTDIQKFAEAFRRAEKIELPVNSMFVIFNESNTVTIQLTGTNALKVPAADYEVSYDLGFVQNIIGNKCDAANNLNVPAPGKNSNVVAKPFIRVIKPKEIIASQTPSGTAPRYYISNWQALGEAEILMDCRTPGSAVRYNATISTQSAPDDPTAPWSYKEGDAPPVYYYNESSANRPTGSQGDPAEPGTPNTLYEKGNVKAGAPGSSLTHEYNGIRWRAKAVGVNSSGTAGTIISEEVIYRSVLTFQGVIYSSGPFNGAFLPMSSGDQLWVRGGNNVNGTTIPGFPLTNDNTNWTELQSSGERAGIRLMQKITGNNLHLSNWQWVTWDISVPAYVTIFKGVYDAGDETTNNIERITQYGPVKYTSQTDNWSYLKPYYVLFPGGYRWLNSQHPDQSGSSSRFGALTFNAGYDLREKNLETTEEYYD